MDKKIYQTTTSRKKTRTTKLEATCKIDSEALDIVTNLHVLVKKIDHLQLQQANHRDYKISCELDAIKSQVQRTHDFARRILLSNQDYYSILYEREKNQLQKGNS